MRRTHKRSIYFPEEMLAQIEEEMTRQERTLSWLVQQAWRVASPKITSFPGVEEQLQGKV